MENKNESKEEVQQQRLQKFLQTNGRAVLQTMGNIHIRLRHFTRYEIRNITKGYNKTGLLGEGAFGKVYKGVLDDHSPVAVKVYKDGTSKEDFAKEVIVHYQMKHENVVRLMGCCTEKNALIMVMEFVSNGDLNRILHCSGFALPLDKRLDIAIKVAEALWFMHSMHSPAVVIHRDIKPANILLDKDLAPKISDFGIAKLLSDSGPKYTENYIGPIGYVDPAYCSTGILTPKSDVYSFGVVLLELITRKKPVEFNKEINSAFDVGVSNAENMQSLRDIRKLSAKCLSKDVEMRPEIIDVLSSLIIIREHRHGRLRNPSPNNSTLSIEEEKEMKKMTRNYRRPFRKELLQRLCIGVLGEDRLSIVKQLRTHSETDRNTFLKTMNILCQNKHKNVLNIVGFHIGQSVSECTYESWPYLSRSENGSLSVSERNLYETICCTREKPPLQVRLSIAVQCAEALVHIHSLISGNPLSRGTGLSGNFRSANIFLDKNCVPKVFNTNLPTFLGLSAAKRNSSDSGFPIHDNGSQRYYAHHMDISGPLFKPAFDVYSFGVVLLELITWKTARYISYDNDGEAKAYLLATDFLESYMYRRDHSAIEILDEVYDGQEWQTAHNAIDIAVKCLKEQPEMSYVLSILQSITSGGTPTGGNSRQPYL